MLYVDQTMGTFPKQLALIIAMKGGRVVYGI